MSNGSKTLFFFFVLTRFSLAAPCCGGGALIPSLITGDDRAQVTLTVSHDAVTANALGDGSLSQRGTNFREATQTLKLQGAYAFADRFQAGFEVPLVRRLLAIPASDRSETGLGDIALVAGYEFLPELTYSPWKPRGFVFVRGVLPTGRSIYDDTNIVNNFGRGFTTLAGGIALAKNWGALDALLSWETHYSFGRAQELAGLPPNQISGAWGTGGLIAFGVSPGRGSFRAVVSFSPTWDAGRTVDGVFPSEEASRLVWNVSLQLGMQLASVWSTSLSYHDQTLIPGSRNTTLSRGVTLLLQRRVEL